MESNHKNAPAGPLSNGLFDKTVCITVRSIRTRRVDTEGISFKAALDGLVEAQVLKDDSTEYVQSVTFDAVEIGPDEKTIIVIKGVERHEKQSA